MILRVPCNDGCGDLLQRGSGLPLSALFPGVDQEAARFDA